MPKITLIEEGKERRTVVITEQETPVQILQFFHINPDTKVVALNGTILSRVQMNLPIRTKTNAYLAVWSRSVG